MSDIQQYLLDYDRNRNEASATAQKSATRTFDPASPFERDEQLTLNLLV
jgi:hypothetical protein